MQAFRQKYTITERGKKNKTTVEVDLVLGTGSDRFINPDKVITFEIIIKQ